MKTTSFTKLALIILSVMTGLGASGRGLDVESAKDVAMDFMRKHVAKSSSGMHFGRSLNPVLERVVPNGNEPGLYVFNFEGGGFAVVDAAGSGVGDVVAYSATGKFDYENAPSAALDILKCYLVSDWTASAEVESTMATVADGKSVGPLVETLWDQGTPYNLFCPVDPDENVRSLTGCTATAMSQLMRFYRYPAVGKGEILYEWKGTRLGANLNESTYLWDKMLPTYDGSSPMQSNEAVARLMADVGYALNTNYSAIESGASNLMPVKAFTENFGYDKSIRRLEKRFFSDEEWAEIIINELNEGRPLMYSGSDEIGHAYVCDGYDAEGMLHFNFGWSGNSDGYYRLGSQPYGKNGEIHCNIMPDKGGEPVVEGFFYTDFCANGDMISFGFKIMAGAATDIPVTLGYAIKNSDTGNVRYYALENMKAYCWLEIVRSTDEIENLFLGDQNAGQVPLAEGSYVVYPVYKRGDKEADWQAFHFNPVHQKELNMEYRDGKFTFENRGLYDPIDEGTVAIGGVYYKLNDVDQTAVVTRRNALRPSYSGDVIIPSTVTIENKTYTVRSIGESAFEVCRGLKSVVIPKTIKTIERGAFSQSTARTVTFETGSELEEIGEYALNAMDYLTSIELPAGLKVIRKAGLRGIMARKIDIPESVTMLEDEALSIYTLRDLAVHSLAPINAGMITDHPFTVYLHVPAGCEDSYRKAEPWCRFIVDSLTGRDKPVVKEIGGLTYEIDYVAAVVNPNIGNPLATSTYSGDLVIPETVDFEGKSYPVAVITDGAFRNSAVRSVTLPDNLVKIETSFVNDGVQCIPFENCLNLEKVVIGENSKLRLIDQNAFLGCTSLTDIKLPQSLKSINAWSFKNTGLKSISIPGNISNLEFGAFMTCPALKDIYLHWSFPPNISNVYDNVFDMNVNPQLHVPSGKKINYTSYESWKDYNFIEDENCEAIVDIEVEPEHTTIGIPEEENASSYKLTVYDALGEVYDSRDVPATRAAGLSCRISTSAGCEFLFRIDAYSGDGILLKSIDGVFNTHNPGKSSVEAIPADFDGPVTVYGIDGTLISRDTPYQTIVTRLPRGIYILEQNGHRRKLLLGR